MQKLVLISGIIAVIAMSCGHNNLYQPKQADFENIALFTSYEVQVEEGAVTIVTYGDDTLAITGIPMVIDVPKYALVNQTKAADGIKTEYSRAPKFEGYKNLGTSQVKFTLFFEDTRSGDNDYNDLILSVKRDETNAETVKCSFEITPIALGATKIFKLGFVEGNTGKKYIVCENCREELFDGRSGFINTDPAKPIVTDFKTFKTSTYTWSRKKTDGSTNWNTTLINWFIETETERMYIALSDKAVNQTNIQDFGNDKGKPYGIAMPWNSQNPYDILNKYGGPYYPTERTPIQKVYGNFDDWVSGVWTKALTDGGGKGVNNTDHSICFNISNPR